MRHWWVVSWLMLATPAVAQSGPVNYRVGVVSESGDIATWLKPVGDSLAVERVVPLGIMPTDIDGPHNIAMAPDQRSYYVSIAHGTPFGALWQLDAASDSLIGRVQVELFPTTISLTPSGQFAFVANSDFHGDHPRTNVLSVVHTPTMNKITDIPVCDMPHGVKVNHAGTKVYVSCMHGDEILELDMRTFAIARRSRTGDGHPSVATGPAHHGPPAAGAAPGATECSPTFVSVSLDDRHLYVACNHRNSLQVWDAAALTRVAEIPVGKGAYNVEPSPDGKLVVVTNKKDQSISLIDAVKLKEVGRVATSKKIVHGVAFSPDRRLAFISSESIGTDPGAVDVIDLAARKRVATTIIPGQPTGITVQRSLSASSRP
jgi:DNA-binding beta-propeller fold protein YncE